MRKKIVTVLLTLVMAASAILGGCGEAEETGGRAERREETRESEESRETQNESNNTENVVSDILGDEPERLVKPEELTLDVWFEYEYDEAGNLTGEGKYGADGSVFYVYYEYEYDKSSNLTKRVCYNADGSVYNWCEYKCDASGNRTKEIGYGSDGNILSWYEYEYDEAGNLTKTVTYNADGSVQMWNEYEYDESGNIIKCSDYHLISNDSYVVNVEVPDIEENVASSGSTGSSEVISGSEETVSDNTFAGLTEGYTYVDPNEMWTDGRRSIPYYQRRNEIIEMYIEQPYLFKGAFGDIDLNEALRSEGCMETSKIDAINKVAEYRDEYVKEKNKEPDFKDLWRDVIFNYYDELGYDTNWIPTSVRTSQKGKAYKNLVYMEGEEFENAVVELRKEGLLNDIEVLEYYIENIGEKSALYQWWVEELEKDREELSSLGE